MKKYAGVFLAVMIVALLAPSVFAADAPAEASPTNWVAITTGFAFAIAVVGCAYGQGRATAAACESYARNPGAQAAIRLSHILGIVFIETLALFLFALILLKVKN